MQNEATLGRPPLPDSKKRKNRRVGLFTDDEVAEIDAYLERNGQGINELIRLSVLDRVRDDDDQP